jgi:hypothetical protein
MMVATSNSKTCWDVFDTEQTGTLDLPKYKQREALCKASIANLNSMVIDNMNCEELVEVIDSSELLTVQCSELPGHLAFFDRETLVRLAHIARRYCQNQA